MADKYITASTLPLYWSVQSNWNGSTFPTSADIVYASGKTITINTNITANTITTASGAGISSGGTFSVSGGSWTLNTNISAGTTACLTISLLTTSQTTTISGNTIGGSLANAHGITKTSGSTLNIIGNVTGGINATAYGLNNAFSGSAVFITGNSLTTSTGTSIYHNSTSALTLNGDIKNYGNVGGSTTAINGINNVVGGTVNVVGNVINYVGKGGSAGIVNTATGTINLTGNVYSFQTYLDNNTNIVGNVCYGILNNSTGNVFIIGDVYGGGAGGSIRGVSNGPLTTAGSFGNISITGNVYSFNREAIWNNGNSGVNLGTINITSPNGITAMTGYEAATRALIINNGSGVINIRSNIYGSSSDAPRKGIVVLNNSTGTINITGNTFASDVSVSTTEGLIHNNSTGTINISGNIYGGSSFYTIGVSLGTANGVLNISGNVYGGSNSVISPAIYTTVATGSINITGSCIGGTRYPAIHAGGTGIFTNVVNGSMIYTNGIAPIYAITPVRINVRPTSQTPLQSIIMTDTNNNNRYFLTTFTANTTPFSGDVLNGTIYSGYSPTTTQYTGSCVVPPSSAVTLNVPVRDIYGIASGMTINNLTSIISSYIL